MNRLLPPSPADRRIRADGWTDERRVTFCVTLAASGRVTLAAASAGLSRKSAYALKKRDLAFAFLWDRSLAAARAARQQSCRNAAKGNEIDAGPEPRRPINFVNRRNADIAERNRYFAALESPCPPLSRARPSGRPLAFLAKESDASRLESAGRSTCDSAPPVNTEEGRVACPEQPMARG